MRAFFKRLGQALALMEEGYMKRMLLFLALASMASGCATGRLHDLRDCGKLSFGYGIGLCADIGIGALSHPSLGLAAETKRLGFESRHVSGSWSEGEMAFPMILLPALTAEAQTLYPLPYNLSYSRRIHPDSMGSSIDGWINIWNIQTPPEPFFARATDLEVGATLFVASVRVGVNPLEFIDFLLGFAGIDIAGDDPKEPDIQEPTTH